MGILVDYMEEGYEIFFLGRLAGNCRVEIGRLFCLVFFLFIFESFFVVFSLVLFLRIF